MCFLNSNGAVIRYRRDAQVNALEKEFGDKLPQPFIRPKNKLIHSPLFPEGQKVGPQPDIDYNGTEKIIPRQFTCSHFNTEVDSVPRVPISETIPPPLWRYVKLAIDRRTHLNYSNKHRACEGNLSQGVDKENQNPRGQQANSRADACGRCYCCCWGKCYFSGWDSGDASGGGGNNSAAAD